MIASWLAMDGSHGTNAIHPSDHVARKRRRRSPAAISTTCGPIASTEE
jgi:hypothetical protein